MGYNTEFEGAVQISPPLSAVEIDFLKKFSAFNATPDGQPSYWCQWAPSDDGTMLAWDGEEGFYESEAWMRYVIDHFIGIDPIAAKELPFLTGHSVSGVIEAQGEDDDDHYFILVDNCAVTVAKGHWDEISAHERVRVESLRPPEQPFPTLASLLTPLFDDAAALSCNP
jgi:hypothetical protein